MQSKTKSYKNIEWKFYILCFFGFVPFIYLFFTLYKIQIVKHDKYSADRETQYKATPDSSQRRGTIYGTLKDGSIVPIANLKTMYKLSINPKLIKKEDAENLYLLLSKAVTLDKKNFIEKVNKQTQLLEFIQNINLDEKLKIENINVNGLVITETKERNYPMSEVGAKVIGFVGGGDDGYRGRAGLEKYYDDMLQVDTTKTTNFFAKLFESLDSNSQNVSGAYSIVTALEPNIMKYVYTMLGDMRSTWGSDMAAAIVMNVNTGEIISMESLPTYDPNKYKEYGAGSYINPLIQGIYELGSIVKPITMAGGIYNKLITPESYFHDTGSVTIDGYTITNFDGKVRGDVTMQTVLGQSLNTGMVYIMRLLGKEKFVKNFQNFGLTKETGVDFGGELVNKTKNIESSVEVDRATAAFGQGIAITPLSILRSLSSIPNDGKLLVPHFATKKVDASGIEESIVDTSTADSISKETAETMQKMLINILDTEFGKGKYRDPRYAVGVKSGTAQTVNSKGEYSKDKFLHSYFMFLGSGDKKFAVLLMQVNPKNVEFASVSLTPYAVKLKNFLITYYEIPPDR
jgi:stage V sporulation protein D (sporulation-specific penicillin-binding protein)